MSCSAAASDGCGFVHPLSAGLPTLGWFCEQTGLNKKPVDPLGLLS